MNNQEFIKNLSKGDAKAYQHLFSMYYEWLCNYIFKLCNDKSLSEDIVQNALVAIWEKRERIIITTSLKNYLFKTCHNQFLQYVRSKKMTYDTLDKIRWDIISDVVMEDDQYEERIEKLHKLINQLPPRCKEIFVQSKLEKKKYKEIAFEMGISVKTVENQMSKALHFLKTNATSFLL